MREHHVPGVHIEETSFRPRSIEGQSTSVAGFVGPTRFGPVTGEPQRLTSFSEFERVYGGLDPLTYADASHPNDLAVAVRGFFENGGQELYVVRVYESSGDGRARCEVASDDPGAMPMVLQARHPGEAGNFVVTVEAQAAPGAPPSEVTLTVTVTDPGSAVGDLVWNGLHPEPDHPGGLLRTFALELSDREARLGAPLVVEGPGLADAEAVLGRLFGSLTQLDADLAAGAARARFGLSGGTDGLRPGPESFRSALVVFEDREEVSIVAAPGSSRGGRDSYASQSVAVARLLVAHCERMSYRIAVLDSPDSVPPEGALRHRGQLDSSHAAYYYPWIEVLDAVTGGTVTTPPSGFVAGVYARNDLGRGVHKAPAGLEVRSAVGLERRLDDAQQDLLNPTGVNCLRYFEGRGYLVWGARTISSDPEWKYVNIRRYFAYLEHSIEKGTRWAVFEPNGERLWGAVRGSVEAFLLAEFRSGRLQGGTPDNAFFVKCDRTTMTQDDIDSGRLICLVGVAPTRPAEFVIFRIVQRIRAAEG